MIMKKEGVCRKIFLGFKNKRHKFKSSYPNYFILNFLTFIMTKNFFVFKITSIHQSNNLI